MPVRSFKSDNDPVWLINYALDPIPSLLLNIGPGIVASFLHQFFPLYWLIPTSKQTKTLWNNFNQLLPHHSTETALVKVTHDLQTAKSMVNSWALFT